MKGDYSSLFSAEEIKMKVSMMAVAVSRDCDQPWLLVVSPRGLLFAEAISQALSDIACQHQVDIIEMMDEPEFRLGPLPEFPDGSSLFLVTDYIDDAVMAIINKINRRTIRICSIWHSDALVNFKAYYLVRDKELQLKPP